MKGQTVDDKRLIRAGIAELEDCGDLLDTVGEVEDSDDPIGRSCGEKMLGRMTRHHCHSALSRSCFDLCGRSVRSGDIHHKDLGE